MLYEDNVEKIKERIREMDPAYKMNKVLTNLSTGGKIERKLRQRVGKKANKSITGKMDKTYAYDVVDKIYKKVENITQK